MKSKMIVGFFLFLVQPVLAAETDSCVADVSRYTAQKLRERTPLLKAKAKNVKKAFPSELTPYGFKDRIRLKSGVEVTFTVGGCSHYGYRFTFVGKGIAPVKESERFDRAMRLLKDLELSSDDERSQLLKALSEAKLKKARQGANGYDSLPCGDANCELVDRGDQTVEIAYDFAL